MHRILLIDDTPEIAELLTFSLRDNGFDVYVTGYITDVGNLLDEQHAQALVVNCTEYKMSEAVFDAVREIPEKAEFPIVIISDTPEIADKSLQARNATNVLLIPKPFTGSQVARALTQLLA